MPLLSVVIPVHIGPASVHVSNRIPGLLSALADIDTEVLVADASPRENGTFAGTVRSLGGHYIRCRQDGVFSPGRARDEGAKRATGRFLFFLDADLAFEDATLDAVRRELQNVGGEQTRFLMLPCLYLTKRSTRSLESGSASVNGYWKTYLRGDFSGIINLAVASSAIVIDRMTYLSIGGHRPEFAGHGCEDLELINRLTLESPLGLREPDHHLDVRQDVVAYSRGFRRCFAYHGIPCALRGLVLAHRWHPRPITARYFRSRVRNDELFQGFLRRSEQSGDCPPALPDLNVPGRTLVCVGEDVMDVQALRQFLPELGRYEVVPTSDDGPVSGFERVLYVGRDAARRAGRWRGSVSERCGALMPEPGSSTVWRLTWWRSDGALVADERHTGRKRYYGDGKSFRWVFYRGEDCRSGRLLYAFDPPDYGNLAPLPPLDEFICAQMIEVGYPPVDYPGLFMNQWGQMGILERWRRRVRKLILKPGAFFEDSRVLKALRAKRNKGGGT